MGIALIKERGKSMKSKLIVSLDFELFWGVQDTHTKESYEKNILGGRKAIPELLKLFEKYNIHATWATVGFLFAESAEEAKRYFPEEKLMPTYTIPERSAYRCFDEDATDGAEKERFYAPEIISLIAKTQGQEIGSHTFSHFYCREEGQTVEQFEADMLSAKKIAEDKGYSLTSVILPRNQCEAEYTEVLQKLGFTAYRDEENDWIHEKVKIRPLMRLLRLADVYLPLTGQGGYIAKNENGIWNLVGSRMYKPYFRKLGFLEKLKIHRIKKQMLHAAKKGLTFHFWWHPHNIGVQTELHLKQLEEVFCYYDKLREKYGMESVNMREAVEILEGR